MHHCKRESSCYCRIHCIATRLHDLDPGARSQLVGAYYNGMLRVYRFGRRGKVRGSTTHQGRSQQPDR